MKYALLLITSLFTCHTFSQSKDCLKYGPTLVQVTGVVKRDTFPVPQNYESIKPPVVYWILKLSEPVCTIGTPDDDMNRSESDIMEMQLVLTAKQYKKYRKLIGKKVIVNGTLFHAITGHHNTAVLIDVVKMMPTKS